MKKMGMRIQDHVRISRTDCERLLRGRLPEGEGLEQLVSAVQVLEKLRESIPAEETVTRFAVRAAASVSKTAHMATRSSVRLLGAARPSRVRKRRLRPALVAAATAVVLVMSASAGVAYAADGAVPGDTLYGLDLALEKVGIGNGGLGERLNEAGELVSRGRAQEGLDLAGQAIEEAGSGDQTLLAAAERLRVAAEAAFGGQNLDSPEMRERIAEKLRSMAAGGKAPGELERAARDLADSLNQESSPVDSDGSGGSGGSPGQGQDGTSSDTEAGNGGGQQNGGSGEGNSEGDPGQQVPGSSVDPAGNTVTSTTHGPNGGGQSR